MSIGRSPIRPPGVKLMEKVVSALRYLQNRKTPKSMSFFDCSGPHITRWPSALVCGTAEYVPSRVAFGNDFVPTNPKDDKFYRCNRCAQPHQTRGSRRWWYPRHPVRADQCRPPPAPIRISIRASAAHKHECLIRSAPTACNLAIPTVAPSSWNSPQSKPDPWSAKWNPHPPLSGFRPHRMLRLFSKDILIVNR